MRRYIFQWHDLAMFIISARNKKNAVKLFTEKVRGKFGFRDDLKLSHVKEDISRMNIVISRETKI